MLGRAFQFILCVLSIVALWATGAVAGLSDYYDLKKPAGTGPFPALIMVAGCSGYAGPAETVYDKWQDQFVAAGFVVVKAEFLKPRALSNCAAINPFRYLVTKKEAAGDIYQAIGDLIKTGFVDPLRISLIGWSFGGGSVLQALSGGDPSRAKIHSVVSYYPDCYQLDPWSGSTRTLILFGGNDTTALPSRCREVMAKMTDTASIKTIEYPGAMHAFDFPFLGTQGITTPLGVMGYNPAAATQAWDAALAFLKQ